MTQENKELLLKDLCGRLPYGVKIKFNDGTYNIYNLDGNIKGKFTENVLQAIEDLELRPYLRPMSSMTKEEQKGYEHTMISLGYYDGNTIDTFDWLNAHHFDYRGLIPKGLAIAVTKENNPYKE